MAFGTDRSTEMIKINCLKVEPFPNHELLAIPEDVFCKIVKLPLISQLNSAQLHLRDELGDSPYIWYALFDTLT